MLCNPHFHLLLRSTLPLVLALLKKSDSKSDRQARLLNFLAEHLNSLQYIKGDKNVVADFLSRPSNDSSAKINSIHIEQFDLSLLGEEQSREYDERYRHLGDTVSSCQQNHVHRHTKTTFQEFQHPSQRFARVHIDIVGPLPASPVTLTTPQSYQYLLTCVDSYTRWVEALPLCSITADEVASAFINVWISRFGVPLEIVTIEGANSSQNCFKTYRKNLDL